MSSLTTTHAAKGLEGVVATASSICYIDGERGVLAYRGIDIHELADNSNFEETCYLLWFGKLPTRNQLKELHERLAEERKLDASIINLLGSAPKHALPMDVLRTAVSALSFYDPEEKNNDHDANVHKAIRLTSQIAMIVAAYDRIRKGKNVVEPDKSLSHSASFLLQLNGTKPSSTAERALDIALILHADHELIGIAVRLYLMTATIFDYHLLGEKYRIIFPALLLLDMIWALSPLLLADRMGMGLALGACAAEDAEFAAEFLDIPRGDRLGGLLTHDRALLSGGRLLAILRRPPDLG